MFCSHGNGDRYSVWGYLKRLAVLGWLIVAIPASADQHATELPGLFDQLLEATEQSEVSRLENEIWKHWLDAPDEASALLMSQISRAIPAGELDFALMLCNRLIDSSEDYAEAWNKRATVHYLLGNNGASVADIRETLVREPRHFGAISGLGLIFLREQNPEAALEAFEEVLAISPNSESARISVQRIRRELGREI